MPVSAPSKFTNYLDRPDHLKSHFLKTDLMPWMDSPFKGIQFKTLFEDKASGMSTLLVKLEPGAVVPLHEHTAFEQTYVLQGSLEDDEGKAFSGELQERIGQAALDILGTAGLFSEEAPGAPVGGEMEQLLRHSIMGMIGGGTSEIQRNLIAIRGLNLPR